MMPVLRLGTALLIAALCTAAACWLTLVCVDLVGFDDGLGPRPGWTMFASVSALALALPPALHAWPDLSRQPSELLRESLRAVLLSFALFAAVFLAGARPFFAWLNIPPSMAGMAAANISLALSCPLAFLSYTASRKLLPHPAPEQPAPPAMRRFGWLTLSFLTLAAAQPWLTGGEALIFPSRLALICAAWIIIALRMALLEHGEAGFVPMWGGFCLICAFRIGRSAPYAHSVDLAIGAILLALALWSCFCLLRTESREWLR